MYSPTTSHRTITPALPDRPIPINCNKDYKRVFEQTQLPMKWGIQLKRPESGWSQPLVYHNEYEFTWTRVFIACFCLVTFSRAWLPSKSGGGIGAGSGSILYSATTCDWAITPVLPVGPITINCNKDFDIMWHNSSLDWRILDNFQRKRGFIPVAPITA